MHPDRFVGTTACLLAVASFIVQIVRGKNGVILEKLCAVVPALSCMGAPELWKAVPVQEYNSMSAAGDFGAYLTTPELKRKLTQLHRWLQKPLALCLPVFVRIN